MKSNGTIIPSDPRAWARIEARIAARRQAASERIVGTDRAARRWEELLWNAAALAGAVVGALVAVGGVVLVSVAVEGWL